MQIGIILQKVIIFLFQVAIFLWESLTVGYSLMLPFDVLFVIYYISVLFIPVTACIVPWRIAKNWWISTREAKRINAKIDIALATIINLKYWSLTSELIHDFFAGMFKW